MKNYKNRILDAVLERRFKSAGAILLEGMKWCGKTTTCEQLSKSVIYMDEPEKREHNTLILNSGVRCSRGDAEGAESYKNLSKQCHMWKIQM